MKISGTLFAPNVQTLSSISKGALRTFRIETKSRVQYLTYVYICHGLLYNRHHTSRIC